MYCILFLGIIVFSCWGESWFIYLWIHFYL